MPYTTEDVIAVAPSNYELATTQNRAELHRRHAHPFTEDWRLMPGDLVWSPLGPAGHHLVVVWIREQRAGLGRNGDDGLHEGVLTIEGGRPFVIESGLVSAKYDLITGRVVRA